MSALRTRMIRDMALRGFSPRTHEAYIAAVVCLAKYYKRAPDQLTNDEVQVYLAHLIQDRKLSWSTCSQAAHACRFLYHVTLGQPRADFHVPAPKQPQKLPEILSREEVWRVLNACTHVRHRLLLATTYAAGLRVSEAIALKVSDLDADRMTVRVEQGKGAKDRYVPLSTRLLQEWRAYWKTTPPRGWLFANRQGTRRIDVTVAQRIFHLVFTLPHALNALAQGNPRLIYTLLFHATADTLTIFAHDPRHLGGDLGVTAILHTWGQNLSQPLHLHCVVTGGALAPDGSRWLSAPPGFLFPVRALAQVFRGKYLDALRRAFHAGKLVFAGSTASLADPGAFAEWLAQLRQPNWVVYAKRPFADPEQVLEYLGRYTHRLALSSERIVSLADGRVRFRWKDYADGNRRKVMEMEAAEFIRRFLLHVVPDGFVRIRHFGLLANCTRTAKLAQCRQLLARCPVCQQGRVHVTIILPSAPHPARPAPIWDSS